MKYEILKKDKEFVASFGERRRAKCERMLNQEQNLRIKCLHEKCQELATDILENCPDSHQRKSAVNLCESVDNLIMSAILIGEG